MTIVISKSIVYREIPTGLPIPDQHFQVVSTELDLDDLALEHGDFVTKTLYLSVDPYQRSKMREPSIESYNSAYELNKIMSGGAISQVIQSNNPTFRVGDYVTGGSARWEEYSVIRRAQASQFRNTTDRIHQVGLPLRHWLNVLGGTGLTAYVGFRLFGDIRPGKTIYISGAAGATGYVIAQIAKIKGLRVIGSTGDDAKVLFLMETAGIDAAFNYKKISVDEALSEYAPDGIDFFFDNVGGETLEATINHANTHARFILCGAISGYNQSDEERYGVKNLFKVVSKRLDIKGFLVSEAAPPFIEDFHREVVGWVKSGELVVSDSVVEGIENTPKALVDMLQGKNLGKQLVKVAEEDP
ncbi:hypothetical protein BC936DRAFT_144442 [Jimgerdemannia flammicorona]|uniref:Enoyl reductase (ER) domain-containing protein n=1 Tax=Jimgerdemannia flammicorona TaxID=994334 RepID=A0A433DCG8_9FUNG|nr:hypothetical protein BC936DRAFT_144442 [Jimgerdemannia flammicorona]RUP48534.1 hypothetical protein BC936DRAFT_144442 [Jimgerdemannia flammicorona]